MVRITSCELVFICMVYFEVLQSFVLICSLRSHSVNLVHIAGQTYLVDVGFGGKYYI